MHRRRPEPVTASNDHHNCFWTISNPIALSSAGSRGQCYTPQKRTLSSKLCNWWRVSPDILLNVQWSVDPTAVRTRQCASFSPSVNFGSVKVYFCVQCIRKVGSEVLHRTEDKEVCVYAYVHIHWSENCQWDKASPWLSSRFQCHQFMCLLRTRSWISVNTLHQRWVQSGVSPTLDSRMIRLFGKCSKTLLLLKTTQ